MLADGDMNKFTIDSGVPYNIAIDITTINTI